MSKQMTAVPVAVAEGAETAVVTRTKQPTVVDRGLVAQLVGDAQRQGLRWTGRAACWPS